MSLLSRLFGGRAPDPARAPENHNGFAITPDPQPDGGRWRVTATIEKDGRTHRLIRADVLETRDAAEQVSLDKAKQMIDEQGERLFD